ncbi:MAG: bifunctional folylpolyglutamate synthase/dihydrofolate synthase [Candidatus Krumholzibacteriia bacterium]
MQTSGLPPFVPDLPELAWLFDLNRFGIRPGLERVAALLAGLGHPERGLRTIVVAGTNGKGSATRLLAALLGAAGHKVACYTSPHLLRVYERLELDGEPCDPARFAAAAVRLRPAIERLDASWFEALTAIALDLCREAGCELLCCEAGLGGRLDATNALPAVATLLTSVALDHEQQLGDTLAQIAAEKLGLLKPGAPLFCAVPEALRAQVFAAGVAAGSPVHFLDEQAVLTLPDATGRWDLATRRGVRAGLPPLAAPWLRRNAALALLCVDELAARGLVRAPADPAAALAGAFLPGRHQHVLTSPDWIFDTAHNGEALRATLGTFLARPVAGRRLVLLGSMREKALDDGVGELLRRCDHVVAAPVALPRTRTAAELAELLGGWRLAGFEVAPDLGAALARLGRLTAAADAVLVTGSCFTVAEVLWRLGFDDLRGTRGTRPARELSPRAAG